MAESHGQFVGSIPEIYDRHLGPLFFHYYAADIARRLAVADGGRVLETACGTGLVTEAIRARLPAAVEIRATDLNEPMLDFARAARGALPNVVFEQADAVDLGYAQCSFDAVVCQFGLMFFADKPRAMRQALRVLKPGGQYIFSVWDALDANPIARVTRDAIARHFAGDPPSFLLTPFGCYAIDPLKQGLLETGFEQIEISVVATIVEYPSAAAAARGLVEGNPGVHEIRERSTSTPERVAADVAAALRENFGDQPMRAALQAIVFAARRPVT